MRNSFSLSSNKQTYFHLNLTWHPRLRQLARNIPEITAFVWGVILNMKGSKFSFRIVVWLSLKNKTSNQVMNTCLSGLTGSMTEAVTRMDQRKDCVYRPRDMIGCVCVCVGGWDFQEIYKCYGNNVCLSLPFTARMTLKLVNESDKSFYHPNRLTNLSIVEWVLMFWKVSLCRRCWKISMCNLCPKWIILVTKHPDILFKGFGLW